MCDELSKDERIRLEALAQAVAQIVGISTSAETTITVAKRFERYIKEGEQ